MTGLFRDQIRGAELGSKYGLSEPKEHRNSLERTEKVQASPSTRVIALDVVLAPLHSSVKYRRGTNVSDFCGWAV